MNFQTLVKEAEVNGSRFSRVDNGFYSMDPPETLFGFTYYSHMIPPFKPLKSLILGCAGFTVNRLCRKIWGDDLEMENIDISLGTPDAGTFLEHTYDKFDFICLDLWNGSKVCSFIYDAAFVGNLRRAAKKMICMNIPKADLINSAEAYSDNGFEYLRHDIIEENATVWWAIK